MKRTWLTIAALIIAAFGLKAYSDTMATPEIKRATLHLPGIAADAAPVIIALVSDIHVAGPDMPPERLTTIVRQINDLSPDIVMIAGDFISDKRTATRLYSGEEAVAPLDGLDDRITKIAVPGNHDHWYEYSGIKAGLTKANVTLLVNDAMQVGPLVIGGVDDHYTGRADVGPTKARMDAMSGGRIILSHSPDIFPDLPADFGLVLAGHTHCGQIRYPWGGSPATMSDYGNRYACGRADENGNTIVTGAGLGTSILPVRLFSKPEIWLITIRPPNPQ